jgi:prevent-host-death family protein
MAEKVSAAKAKAQLSALMAAVAYGGKHFIIERRGKPLAALVSVEDLERLEQGQATLATSPGFLALVGAWGQLTNEEIDSFVADIYAAREKDFGRPVELED